MKVCLSCGERFSESDWKCPVCFKQPPTVDEFLVFDKELDQKKIGYDPWYFKELVRLEAENFWFRSRNQLIKWALSKYFCDVEKFLEIGCGTGFVLSAVERSHPYIDLFGSEIFVEGLNHASKRLENTVLFQMDARVIPFEKEFDVIGAFDVLEHIKEDETVLLQMHQALRRDGGIILTVPQHAFLWSQTDERAGHVRRYNARELKTKVLDAGFDLVRVTSFVTLLLPLMIVSRINQRLPERDYDPLAELRISGILNVLLGKVLMLERKMIRSGLSLPFGGSLLVVAKKKSH